MHKDLYAENCKTWEKKEIKKDLSKCAWVRTLTVIKISIPPTTNLFIQCSFNQNPSWIFYRNWQVDSRLIRKIKWTIITKAIFIKNKFGWLTLPDLQNYFLRYCDIGERRDLYLNQWNRRESPEIDWHIYG